MNILTTYFSRIKSFKVNARLYLISVLVNGATMGVFRLLFNFYVLSLGFDEALLGQLITTSQITALVLAVPMGYLVDKIGKKPALMARSVLLAVAVGTMALFPSIITFFAMNAVFGIAQSISAVAMAPFLMENSDEEERTYLFSISSGLQMASVFVGNWVGGFLPTWIAVSRGVDATHSLAYGGAMQSVAIVALLGLIPLSFIRSPNKKITTQKAFAPLYHLKKQTGLFTKLLLPSLIISIGAGMFMPFMNVFFRTVHNQSDQAIGTLFAWGSLAMGIGLLIAPPIAERTGKIKLVFLTQALSIPFMGVLGFAPVFGISASAYYIRMALMNMSNPIYQTFVMEQVSIEARTTIASLVSMVWSFGRAFSPTISGSLQVAYGFGPPFAISMSLYAVAIILYWLFFLRAKSTVVDTKSFN